jgi:hypothetical protein
MVLQRYLGKDPVPEDQLLHHLKTVLQADPKVMDLISPRNLLEREGAPEKARAQIYVDVWLETILWLLRLFPGAGSQSYCKSFGDVSPQALETIFDRPIQQLETLCLRLRSLLVPTIGANEEIAAVLLETLAKEPK